MRAPPALASASMVIAKPSHNNYSDLLNQIENGTIKIPQFQRDFVWISVKKLLTCDTRSRITSELADWRPVMPGA